jgi:hypothetical protein
MGNSFPTVVVPAKAGTHFDLDGRNMDSRFRGNDDMKNPRVTHFRNSQ